MPNTVTLPQHFMKHDYWAGGSGNIYHGRFPDPSLRNTYWFSPTENNPNDLQPTKRPVNGIPRTAHFDWVIGQLGRKHDKPFFLACGIYKPHLQWYVPQKYYDLFDAEKLTLPNVPNNDLDDIPATGVKMAQPQGDHAQVRKHTQWRKAVHGYLASSAFADAQVGGALDALDKSSQAENTIVVLLTDHGWHLGEKKHWRKFTLWDEASRTPLIFVVLKGLTKLGEQVDRPMGLIDIYPTLLDLCGLAANPATKPRASACKKNAKWRRPALTTHRRNNHGLRTPRWRYLRYADGSEELYDHKSAPNEWANLAGNPKLDKTKKRLAEWLPQHQRP